MASGKRTWLALGGVVLLVGASALAALGYPQLAIHSAPRKQARPSDTAEAEAARQVFWTAFHSQRYADIPNVAEALTAAYLRNPADAGLALLIGHTHLWKAAERSRDPAAGAAITDELVLASFYFREARGMQPDDHRISGWLASTELALGALHGDEPNRRRAYFALKQAARDHPEFNHFTLAYVLSRLPAGDPRLRDAVESMWSALDACVDRKVDRHDPDVSSMGSTAVPEGPGRVCFNGPSTPHNVEGFFLAFGDLLVKSGNPGLARTLYAKARVAPSFEAWPFRTVLEERIVTAEVRASQFAAAKEPGAPEMIATSAHACAVCHAR